MKEIGDTLTEEILFGQLAKGGEAFIDEKNKELTFRIHPIIEKIT